MKNIFTVIFLLTLLFIASCSDQQNSSDRDNEPDEDSIIDEKTDDADSVEEIVFPTKEEMRKRVDEFWGEAPDKTKRLDIFDIIWETLGKNYAGFVTGHVDWDEIRDRYRPEIENTESFGHFYYLMSSVYREIQDSHAYIDSEKICRSVEEEISLKKRPPVFIMSTFKTNIGACVTVDRKGQLLVYEVEKNNPAGLEPGDIIVGYDGRMWDDLLDMIFGWELPTCGISYSSDEAQEFFLKRSVMNNTHLFKYLNFKKYGSDEILSYNTDDIQLVETDLKCTDQLPVENGPEIVKNWAETSWGRLPDSNIGYIYITATDSDNSKFEQAVKELMDTDGLIIDERFNGGGWGAQKEVVKLLFNKEVRGKLFNVSRYDEDDYLSMDFDNSGQFYFEADPETFYDKPIAVLVGPLAGSGGDIFPYLMSFHPKAKRFGMVTNGSFGSMKQWYVNRPESIIDDFYLGYTLTVCYDEDMNLMQGKEEYPEVDVWFNQEDVRNGVDSVAKKAIDWIMEERDK